MYLHDKLCAMFLRIVCNCLRIYNTHHVISQSNFKTRSKPSKYSTIYCLHNFDVWRGFGVVWIFSPFTFIISDKRGFISPFCYYILCSSIAPLLNPLILNRHFLVCHYNSIVIYFAIFWSYFLSDYHGDIANLLIYNK